MTPLELVTNLAFRCHHLYWFQIWPQDDYLQIWPADCTTCITNKFALQTKSHALPDCLGLPYWHYQLVLTWYLHQPTSHQLTFNKVSQLQTTGPIDRTPLSVLHRLSNCEVQWESREMSIKESWKLFLFLWLRKSLQSLATMALVP